MNRNQATSFIELDGWKHSEQWVRRHKSFTVEVKRHEYSNLDGEVVHNWCVYLHVFDNHPTFQHFIEEGTIWDNAFFDCHSYCSYHKVNHDNAGKIVGHTIGWDYSHDGDGRFAEYATASDASTVFYDASQLFDEAKTRHDELATSKGERDGCE